MIGKNLAHYRIVGKLGEGGMGVVWKALDTQLDREVAIKVLPESFAGDAERVARFEREAKLLASLNHRNIATIHGLGQTDGQRFLVMELVEGQDLATRLRRGPLEVGEALDVGEQLARALEAAHDKGVLHRDLKPANVQLTPEGRVKVLDFGLAKAIEAEGRPDASPTLTSGGTRAGTLLGTAAYMSPEQARGKPLDKRTDIWSFGCVLYECLTGRAAFHGESVSDTLVAILKGEPDWALLPAGTPPRVRELLQRCFEKDAKDRLRDVGDARLELQRSTGGRASSSDVGRVVAAPAAEARPTRRFSRFALFTATLAGTLAGAALWALLSGAVGPGRSAATGVARFSIDLPKELFIMGYLASPDGGAVAYAAVPKSAAGPDQAIGSLYIRRFGDFEPTRIGGSEGSTDMTFSPDGRWIAMRVPVAPKATKYRLSKVPVDGSAPPLAVADWADGWTGPLLWLPDGDLLVLQTAPRSLVRIPAGGGKPRDPVPITSEVEGNFRPSPSGATVLPGGEHLLGDWVTYDEGGWETSVAVVHLTTGKARVVIPDGSGAKWSSTGHLLFTRGASLLAVPFDAQRLETTGPQVAVADGLRAPAIYADAWFDLFPDGTLLHEAGGVTGSRRQLTYLRPDMSVAEDWSEERRPFESGLAVTRDGSRLAVGMVNDDALYEIWVSDTESPRLTRLVRERGKDCTPALWHPDGERLVYRCERTDEGELYLRSADGTGDPRLVIRTASATERYRADAFLGDGSRLIVTLDRRGGDPALMLLALDGAGGEPARPAPLIDDARSGQLSPDGRWLAYVSDASGRDEVYLRGIDAAGAVGREIPVSRDGCDGSVWRSQPGQTPLRLACFCRFDVYEVTLTTEGGLRLSPPRLVASVSELWPRIQGLASLPDGRWLAVLEGEDEELPGKIQIALNWRTELLERLHAAR